MSNCCLKNLGCLQIPVSTISQAGQAGATNTLTIGIVGTGAAAASITGTSPNQVLNLTIPQGIQGNPGVSGTTRLYSFVGNDTVLTTGSFDAVKTYTLPQNTIATNGDGILIQSTHVQTALVSLLSVPQRRIRFNSISTTLDATDGEPFDASQSVRNTVYRTTVEIIRTGATTATCRVFFDFGLNNTDFSINQRTRQVNLTGLDFTQDNDIDFDVFQFFASQSALRTLTIDKLTA
jgi:hypothetical protein